MTAERTSRKNPLAFVVSVATAALISVNASAQLEEVIVTAQKRAESAQDVPIAITAFDSEALTAKQITGFADMRFAAPNVSYTKANFTGNNFQIRGVGTNLVAASADNVHDLPHALQRSDVDGRVTIDDQQIAATANVERPTVRQVE